MADTAEKPTIISITRHAAQAMLHHALDTQPGIGCGLLYGLSEKTALTINRATPVANSAKVRQMISPASNRQDTTLPIGLYRSFPTPETTIADMLSDMPPLPKDVPATGLLYAAISLCTEGRLEIHLFSNEAGTWHERTLSMLEDGALYQTRPNG